MILSHDVVALHGFDLNAIEMGHLRRPHARIGHNCFGQTVFLRRRSRNGNSAGSVRAASQNGPRSVPRRRTGSEPAIAREDVGFHIGHIAHEYFDLRCHLFQSFIKPQGTKGTKSDKDNSHLFFVFFVSLWFILCNSNFHSVLSRANSLRKNSAGGRFRALGDFFGRARYDNAAAVVGCAGAEVDQPIGRFHELQVVLDDDQRMADFEERVEAVQQLYDI